MDPEPLLSQGTYHFFGFIYALLALAAFILNSLVIFTFVKDRSLLVPSNLLILSISVADWLMAVVANPLGVAANTSEVWSLGSTSCVFYAFVTTTLGFGVMMHHSAIAVERCIVLTRPYTVSISNKVMMVVIASLWAFSLLWSAFPLFGWSAYVPEVGRMSCSVRWHSTDAADESYIYAIFTLFYFVPILVIITTYSLMYRSVRHMARNAVRMWGRDAEPTMATIRSKAKTGKMSLIMVTAFLIGWTPYAIVSLHATAGNAEEISPLVAIPSLFAKTTTLYNPVIYFFRYGRFRASLKSSLCSVLGRNVVFPDPSAPVNPANQARCNFCDNRLRMSVTSSNTASRTKRGGNLKINF